MRRVALPIAASFLLLAGVAAADGPAPTPNAPTTALRVVSVSLEVSCEDADPVPRCAIETRYTFSNPTDAPVDAVVARSPDRLRVVASNADTDAMRDKLGPLGGAAPYLGSGLVVSVPPHGTVTGAISGGMSGPRYFMEYGVDGVYARHLALGRSGSRPSWTSFVALSELRAWGDPRLHVKISVPRSLTLETHGLDAAASETDGRTILDADVHASEDATIRLSRPGAALVVNGGPLLAIGDQGGRLLGRVGYELGYSDWMVFSAAYEFTKYGSQIVPTVEVVTPWILFVIPSLGFGAGAPVRLAPDPRVGARLQADLHFGPGGFVTALDLFPAMHGHGATHTWTLAAQLAF